MPIPVVTLITAQKLTPSQLEQARVLLKKKLGSFTLKEEVDSGLMGGLKIQIGTQEFDASLAGKLQKLEPQLPEIRVITVVPITAEQRKQIRTTAEERFGAVTMIEEVDASLIGGIKIVSPSTELDGSIKGKLDKLKQQMLASI